MSKPEYEIKQCRDVRDDEELRFYLDGKWAGGSDLYRSIFANSWVEVRPKALLDPHYIVKYVLEGRMHYITSVGEMRDRTDLDRWEYADNEPGQFEWQEWNCIDGHDAPDNFPVIVRRVKQ